MEADWEVEIGPGAPEIFPDWPGFVDLRLDPHSASSLPESAQLPGLAEVLIQLNEPRSPVWTAKCDVWPVEIGFPGGANPEPNQDPEANQDSESNQAPESKPKASWADPDELDATPGNAHCALACFLDLLPAGDQHWITPPMAVAASDQVCRRLRAFPQRCCRADLIVRRAYIVPGIETLGITAYTTACGATPEDARRTLQAAIAALADAICLTQR
jgi:hypothetical protein